MAASTFIQITPTYPPDISGVGDYAALVETGMCALGGNFGTLVARRGEDRSASGLLRTLEGTDLVLLHFSGYGYHRRGLCRWLVDGLARWKAAGSERRLVTMFHEVCATGPIWRSSFWTAGAQRRIARDLGALSDAGFVSSRGGQVQLDGLAPRLGVELLPVFSNVGEPEETADLADRDPVAVVFGGAARRRRVYEALGRSEGARDRLAALGVEEIRDIGPTLDLPTHITGLPMRPLGPLAASEVSAHLARARIGFIDYPGHVFTKSGIAAAYLAHRLLVVNTSDVGGLPPDVEDGRHLVGLSAFARGDVDAQAVANAGHAWYRPHGVTPTVERFRSSLA